MKKYLLSTLLLLFVVSSCKTKEDRPNILKDVTVNINVKEELRSTDQSLLTPRQIVEKTQVMQFYAPEYKSMAQRGFSDAQRDFQNNRLKMWASDIIREERDGSIQLQTHFLTARDVVLLGAMNPPQVDTIAYIPNNMLEKAANEIRAAFAQKDYAKVYNLFETVYTAIPTTGERYKQLKAEGNN